MKPYLETITAVQQQVIGQLGTYLQQRGMYLAGGTAVALHLGHRQSVDLDWFCPSVIDDPMRLADEIRTAGVPFVTVATEEGTLHGTVHGVRVSLLHYRYPLLQSAEEFFGLDCQLASLLDLAAMKLVAVAQRGSKKDFVDIYALGQKQLPLATMLEAYQRRYSVADVSRVLYSLTYFKDADAESMPVMLWDIDWDGVKCAVREWVVEAAP